MDSKKCPKCGLVSWADSTICKRCGESLLDSDMRAPGKPKAFLDVPGLVSAILFAVVICGLVLGRYLGMFGYPLMFLALLTGLGYSIWRVYRSTKRLDSKRQAITVLVVNAMLAMALCAAAPVVLLRERAFGTPVWREHVSVNGRYSLQLPGEPHEKHETLQTRNGPITVNRVTAYVGQNGEFMSSYFDLSDRPVTVSDDEFLDGVFKQAMSQDEKSLVLSKRTLAVDSATGLSVKALEAEIQPDQQTYGKGAFSILRVYWVRDRSTVYMNLATYWRTPENSATAAKFLESFQLLTQQDIDHKRSF